MPKIAIVLPVVFGAVALGATLGLDFYKKKMLADAPDYSVVEYFDDLAGSFKAQAKEVVANRTLVDFLGEAPEGWTKRTFARSDMEILTGAPLAEPKDAIPGMSQKDKAVMALVGGVVTRGAQKGANTFEKDGTLVIVEASFLPARVMTGFGGKQLGMMADIMNMANMGNDFAIVRGLKFSEPADQRNKIAYRRFTASLGQQVKISVLTNATDDSDVLEVLATLDIASMNQMLVDPIPKMGENDNLLLASAEPGANAQAARAKQALEAVKEQMAQAAAQATAQAAGQAPAKADAQAAGAVNGSGADADADISFADRLTGLFSSAPAQEKEAEKPKRMVCTMQQGFKRCAFPKEK